MIFGPKDVKQNVNIVSFVIKHLDRTLHSNFVVRILSDLFGIQARAGCACASTYWHYLQGIDENISVKYMQWINGTNLQLNEEEKI